MYGQCMYENTRMLEPIANAIGSSILVFSVLRISYILPVLKLLRIISLCSTDPWELLSAFIYSHSLVPLSSLAHGISKLRAPNIAAASQNLLFSLLLTACSEVR